MIWTVTDVMSHVHEISDSSKFGKDRPFLVKVRVNPIWKARKAVGGGVIYQNPN